MTLQRQIFASAKSTDPRKIAFILPGRRTLSEHLPAETIDVSITIAQRSLYLRKAIVHQALTAPTERQIQLPDIDSMGFRTYIEWLETGHINFHTPIPSSGLLLRDSFDLIFSHIVGTKLEDVDFQDYIIDTLARMLDASQSPDLRVLEVVFLEKGASNILKQFVVNRMFAIERKMLGMMRGSVDSSETALGCEYHVHEVGECYKNTTNNVAANGANSAHDSYNVFDANGTCAINGSQQLRPVSASTCHFLSAATINMTEKARFSPENWSQELNGPRERCRTMKLHTDKPLPTIPVLRPGVLPTPPPSPRSFQSSCWKNTGGQAVSTQQIVSECLARLPRTDDSVSKTTGLSMDTYQSSIQTLVLECLDRFKKLHRANSPSSPSEYSPQQQNLSPHNSHTQSSLPLSPLHQPSISPHFLSPLTRASTINRKAAPHRGEDWLKQYDSVNALMKGTPVIMAKRSKKSRFKELLRSESALGRVGVEGSILKSTDD